MLCVKCGLSKSDPTRDPSANSSPTACRLFVFMLVASLLRNMFFPVIEPCGYAAVPTRKTVIGVPPFFVPQDFEGCLILGPRFTRRALILNIAEFLVLATPLVPPGSA